MSTAYIVLAVGLVLLVVRTLVSRFAPPTTPGVGLLRKLSSASLVLTTIALGCSAALNEMETMARPVAAQIAMLGIIPLCVVVASACAVSFFEPIVMPWVLYLLPIVCDFMPNASGPRNPWRSLLGQIPKTDLAPEMLLLLVAFLAVPLSAVGCGVLYISRKVCARRLSWSILRGLAWGCVCAGGAYFGLRSKVLSDITFHHDYRLLWAILGSSVVITALGGLKRGSHAVPSAPQPEGPAGGEAPLGSAAQDGATQMTVTDKGSGGSGTQAAADGPLAPKQRMVGGAKFGLAILCLYVAFLGSILVGHSWWETFHQYVGTSASEMVGYGLLFGLPILIGVAGLITGIQKNRPGIGVLALLTTPIGFFFALGAENRSAMTADRVAPPAVIKRPTGVTVVGWALIVVSAIRILALLSRKIVNNHVLSMLSVSFLPVDSYGMIDVPWMRSVLHLWPFSFFGVIELEYVSIIVAFLTGVLFLRGVGWARWFYLGWGAFGIVEAFQTLYFPLGYLIIRSLIYVSFAMLLLRKNSAAFFSRRQQLRETKATERPSSKPDVSQTASPELRKTKTIESPSNKPDVSQTASPARKHADEKPITDLIDAAAKGDLQTVRTLLAQGVNASASHDGRTALLTASSKGHTDVVKALLEAGADMNARDRALFSQGADALYMASQAGHTDVVRALLAKEARVDAKENNGWTALIKAAQQDHVAIARALLDCKADVNARANDGATALLVAAQQGHAEIVKMLLEEGADVDAQTHDRSTALIQAAQQGHVEVLRALLARGAKVNAKRNDNVSALYLASYNGHADVARVLLDAGADVNVKTNENVRALYSASGRDYKEIVQALIEKGADVNAKNTSDDWTALMRASQQGHLEIVKMLLRNGADVNVRDRDGWTALVAASKKGHAEVVQLLRDSGAR